MYSNIYDPQPRIKGRSRELSAEEKEQSSGAIRPRPLQRQQELAVLALLEPIEGQRRASEVAAQPLQPVALVSANVNASMEVEASEQRTPPRQLRGLVAEHVELPEPSDGLVGPLTEHGSASGRRSVEGMLLLIGTQSFFEQAASVQEAMNTTCDLPDNELDVLGRRLDGDKVRPVPRAASNKDAIGDENVEGNVEIEGAAESLSCRDRSASRRPQSALLRGSLEVAEDGAQDDGEYALAGVEIARAQAGAFLGELGFLGEERASATVATSTACRCLVWPCGPLRKRLAADPALQVRLQRAFFADLSTKLKGQTDTAQRQRASA